MKTGHVDPVPLQQAVGIASDARAYLDAAHKLNDGTVESLLHLLNPIYLLICQSVELMFKAYLASAGVDERERRKIGHNLQKAYGLAIEHGFAWNDPRLLATVNELAPHHGAHRFRYRNSGQLSLPSPEIATYVLRPVVQHVQEVARQRVIAWREANGMP